MKKKWINKKKIYGFAEKYVNKESIQFVLLFVPLTIYLAMQLLSKTFLWDEILDTGILISFIIVSISELVAHMIQGLVTKKCEDAAKLTEDYDKLVNKYCRVSLVTYTNKSEGTEVKFPVEELCLRNETKPIFAIEIENLERSAKYVLPSQIESRSDYLMKAHKQSFLYNNINIRLNDIHLCGDTVKMICSHTTYFDSMITNRAMDYQWENGKTIREVYEPGPFISRLKESKLSNHLGFNGFIETADNKIIFVKRDNNLSIGKGTLANSIGASLKTKYAWDENMHLTEKGLYNAIANEINDELKIEIDPDKLQNSIFAFYRDLVEGGKPQFLFYYKLNEMTVEMFEKNFRKEYEEKDKDAKTDGRVFYYYSLEDLQNASIYPNALVLQNENKTISHTMMPSASAAIVMLMKYKNMI